MAAGALVGAFAVLASQFIWLAPEAGIWRTVPDVVALGAQVVWGGLLGLVVAYVGLRVASAPVRRHALAAMGAMVASVLVISLFVVVGMRGIDSDPWSMGLSLGMVVLRGLPILAFSCWALARSTEASWPGTV